MRTFLLSAILLAVTGFAYARPEQLPVYSISYVADSTIGPNEGKVVIDCLQFKYDSESDHTLTYSCNGSSHQQKMAGEAYSFSFPFQPQRAVFEFWYNANYEEIFTDSIEIRAGVATVIYLAFQSADRPMMMRKPVIYLYPETATAVSVEVKPAGKLTFTYPDYDGAWKVTAQPSGDLLLNGKQYPYLFWESEQQASALLPTSKRQEGFVVAKAETTTFLEEKLTAIGLTVSEQTDFITFWGPQLAAHDQCFVRFVLNESCDQFAQLNISPKPDHVNRVYIVWHLLDSKPSYFVAQQQLPAFDRSGFDVLEWGGTEGSW